MARPIRFFRHSRIGIVALSIALGSMLTPSPIALAGFGSSPGSPGIVAKCDSGTHFPEVALVSRKSGEGQRDFG